MLFSSSNEHDIFVAVTKQMPIVNTICHRNTMAIELLTLFVRTADAMPNKKFMRLK